MIRIGTLSGAVLMMACMAEGVEDASDDHTLLITRDIDDLGVDSEPGEARMACRGRGRRGTKFVTDEGTDVTLCTHESGDFSIVEGGELGHEPAIDPGESYECALDVFLEHAPPEMPIPRHLVEHCKFEAPAYLPRRWEGANEVTDQPRPVWAHYCGSSGAQNFDDEKCFTSCYPEDPYDCMYYCTTALWSSHQRTCSAQMGHNGDHAHEVVASCTNTTRFRAYRENAGVGGLDLEVDTSVSANYWKSLIMNNGGVSDDDFRFKGDPLVSGAKHRHTGHFHDDEWP